MNMNTISKISLAIAVAVISVAILFSHKDYSEEIVSNISEEAIQSIKCKIGHDAGNAEIAREYINNKSFYDAQ